jgi:hypothetical protein
MPWGVYKGNLLLGPVCDKGEGSDLLSDISEFFIHSVRMAQGIQQSGFTMINMTHYRDYRWPLFKHHIEGRVFFVLNMLAEIFSQLEYDFLGKDLKLVCYRLLNIHGLQPVQQEVDIYP